jgi:hypothetical protein
LTGGERGVDGVRRCNTGFVRRMVASALASIDADEVREAKSFGVKAWGWNRGQADVCLKGEGRVGVRSPES